MQSERLWIIATRDLALVYGPFVSEEAAKEQVLTYVDPSPWSVLPLETPNSPPSKTRPTPTVTLSRTTYDRMMELIGGPL